MINGQKLTNPIKFKNTQEKSIPRKVLKYQEIKSNRLRVIENTKVIEIPKNNLKFKVSISSPVFIKNAEINNYSRCDPNNFKKTKDSINSKLTPEEVEKYLKTSIEKRYQCQNIEITIKDFDNHKIGYICFYKPNKYKKQIKENEYISADYIKKIEKSKKEYLEYSKSTNPKDKFKLSQQEETKVWGIFNFKIEIKKLNQETIKKLLVLGIGGKNGLGMGYIDLNENYSKLVDKK